MSFKDCKIHQTKIIWLVNLMKIFSTDIIWQKEGRVNIVVFNFLSLSLSAFVWPTTLKLCRPSSPPCSLSCLRLDFPQLSNEAPGGSISHTVDGRSGMTFTRERMCSSDSTSIWILFLGCVTHQQNKTKQLHLHVFSSIQLLHLKK